MRGRSPPVQLFPAIRAGVRDTEEFTQQRSTFCSGRCFGVHSACLRPSMMPASGWTVEVQAERASTGACGVRQLLFFILVQHSYLLRQAHHQLMRDSRESSCGVMVFQGCCAPTYLVARLVLSRSRYGSVPRADGLCFVSQ